MNFSISVKLDLLIVNHIQIIIYKSAKSSVAARTKGPEKKL
jgi:hypothetical protein